MDSSLARRRDRYQNILMLGHVLLNFISILLLFMRLDVKVFMLGTRRH